MECNLPLYPPVNNLIQPTLYDKLNTIVFERTRAVNSHLKTRQMIQEKVINKHQRDVERVYKKETRKMKGEIVKIRYKCPSSLDGIDANLKNRDSDGSKDGGRLRSLSESSDSTYCKRYYAHHFNIKENKPKENQQPKSFKNDFFNAKLRCFFVNCLASTYRPARDEYLDDVFSESMSDIFPMPNIPEHSEHSEYSALEHNIVLEHGQANRDEHRHGKREHLEQRIKEFNAKISESIRNRNLL
ncbi:hypothetical protein CHS0354_029426 [Potamilus streckersoni]|uniref:Uncharacterized protein n=1 Tax=Potamilus streckersoni TaxID=2493646 RepID=A0AAE0STQ4_9BIVA|nr:hypothetical protein CHS0354_029426 [Potamilus streckersoni]